MHIPIHHRNKVTLDHDETLECPMPAGRSSETF